MIIVTNDEDFLNLINVKGFPPKVILLKTGNQSNSYIESLLIKHAEDIRVLQSASQIGLLEIVNVLHNAGYNIEAGENIQSYILQNSQEISD